MVLGALTNAIPNPFGGFSPFPNSIMIPFMSAQSQALAYGFGIDYEYGKRTIKSMSNEQFNSLTPQDVTNLVNERNNEILQQLQAQLPAFTAFQNEIIDKQVEVEVAKANRTPSAMAEIINALLAGGHQATADAIENYVGTAENKDVALQTLSLISPLFALMGLSNSSGGGGTEEPQPSTGMKLFDWKVFTATNSSPTSYCVSFDKAYEYTYDTTKVEELKASLEQIMNAEEAKYPGQFHNRTDWTFCSTDNAFITSAVKYVRAYDKWWYIHDGTRNKSLPSLNPDDYSL